MIKNKGIYRNLAEFAGWLSIILFILGTIGKFKGQDILLSGNDHWQGSLYLALFAIFAALMARE